VLETTSLFDLVPSGPPVGDALLEARRVETVGTEPLDGLDQTSGTENLQMLGCVGDALIRFFRERFDRARRLT
jgi:hypothetical protein